jgi:hypothetical protein
MALIPIKTGNISADLSPGSVKFESVDQIIIDQITNIKSDFYDPNLLLTIYQTL